MRSKPLASYARCGGYEAFVTAESPNSSIVRLGGLEAPGPRFFPPADVKPPGEPCARCYAISAALHPIKGPGRPQRAPRRPITTVAAAGPPRLTYASTDLAEHAGGRESFAPDMRQSSAEARQKHGSSFSRRAVRHNKPRARTLSRSRLSSVRGRAVRRLSNEVFFRSRVSTGPCGLFAKRAASHRKVTAHIR
jgi:hypothetical protein